MCASLQAGSRLGIRAREVRQRVSERVSSPDTFPPDRFAFEFSQMQGPLAGYMCTNFYRVYTNFIILIIILIIIIILLLV